MQGQPESYFQFFGLSHSLSIDTADLQKRFYDLSRRLHPDRFARATPAEKEKSLADAALLNDAFRVLRDPVARAEYVLKNAGFDIGEQRTKDVPPELLEEVFDLNMALEELREGDASARGQLETANQRFLAMRSEIDTELDELFRAHDAKPEQERGEVLARIRGVLNRRRYIENLVRDVDKELHVHVSD